MNEIKNELLKILKNNARIDINELASVLSIDVETCSKLMTELEEDKVICGYNTLINYDNTDNEIVTALIEVRVSPQKELGFDYVAKEIYKFAEVDSIYLMSGSYDFMVLIDGKSMKQISRFVFEKLSTLDTVLSTSTHFVLKKYKDHGVTLVKDKKNNRMMVSS